MQQRGDVTDFLVTAVQPGARSERRTRATNSIGKTKIMKQNEGVPSPRRSHCRWQLRSHGPWLTSTELLIFPAGLSLLLQLLASTNAQLVIQTDSYSSPPFTIRCNQLDYVMDAANRSCGSQYPILSIEKITLTFSGTIRELCNHSRYEMDFELRKMLNYLDNTCPKNPNANDMPYRLESAVPLFFDSYNRHCVPKTNSSLTAFAAAVNVECIPQRATPRPTAGVTASPMTSAGDKTPSTPSYSSSPSLTPKTTTLRTTTSTPMSSVKASTPIPTSSTITEPATASTTSAEKTTLMASSTSPTIVAITESTTIGKTAAKTNDSYDKIGGVSRELFITLMVVVGVVVLAFILTIVFVAFRGRRRRLKRDKGSVIYPWLNGGGSGDALRLERRDSAYFLGGGGGIANGSIFAPSTIGDADSIRHIRSPSLTPSLLVPFGADSVVALNVNGESRPFVAVPLDAATRTVGGRGSRSSSLSGYDAALDSSSVGSVASAPAVASTNATGLSRYRSLFTRRRSLSAPEELDNAAFEHDYDAQAPWNGKRGPRPTRAATVSSVGRLESIGEELSSIDSAAAARYDADGSNDYTVGNSRQAASARRSSQQHPAAGGRRTSHRDKAAVPNDDAMRAAPGFEGQGASLQARRMTLPSRLGAYGEAAPASYSSQQLPPIQSMPARYSADGRSFSQDGASFKEIAAAEDDDHSDAESSASVGAPTRWPYASRLRLPRTSWSGASGGDGGGDAADRSLALPVRKHGWPGRPTARRQSAL